MPDVTVKTALRENRCLTINEVLPRFNVFRLTFNELTE
jgi:hypothetical protein